MTFSGAISCDRCRYVSLGHSDKSVDDAQNQAGWAFFKHVLIQHGLTPAPKMTNLEILLRELPD
jgi:hypothetical protein